jgi:hypothetical protein
MGIKISDLSILDTLAQSMKRESEKEPEQLTTWYRSLATNY